ncbi:hypothetical protein ACVHNB_15690 [Streptomyces sp. YJ-C3]
MSNPTPAEAPCPLELRDVCVSFAPQRRTLLPRSRTAEPVRAVDHVSLRLEHGKALALGRVRKVVGSLVCSWCVVMN